MFQEKQLHLLFVCGDDSLRLGFQRHIKTGAETGTEILCVQGDSSVSRRVRKVKFQSVWGAGAARGEAGGCDHTGRTLVGAFCCSYQLQVGQELTLNISQKDRKSKQNKSTSLTLLRTAYHMYLKQTLFLQFTSNMSPSLLISRAPLVQFS